MSDSSSKAAMSTAPLNIGKLLKWYGISAVVIVLDQITKVWADEALRVQEIILLPVLKFALAYNQGAAFSFLGTASGWQRWFFSGIAIVLSIAIIWWIFSLVKRRVAGRALELLAFSLVLGGAIGNLIDRLIYGHVIDFISMHYFDEHYFPTFNIADSAICVGAAVLIFDMLFLQGKEHQNQNSQNQDSDSEKEANSGG